MSGCRNENDHLRKCTEKCGNSENTQRRETILRVPQDVNPDCERKEKRRELCRLIRIRGQSCSQPCETNPHEREIPARGTLPKPQNQNHEKRGEHRALMRDSGILDVKWRQNREQ